MPETRRDRLRRELTQQILEVARQQLAERGPGGVSWRGIAREVGMNPASLYTYFDSMDDLYTALIVEGFQSLATAVGAAGEAASGAEPIEHVIACAKAYRAWAIDHPARFNLIFSDQLPGYAAPPGGPTVTAELAVIEPLMQASRRLTGGTDAFDELSAEVQDLHLGLFGLLHGLVALEVNHHLPPGQDHGKRFERRFRQGLDHWHHAMSSDSP